MQILTIRLTRGIDIGCMYGNKLSAVIFNDLNIRVSGKVC